MPRNLALTSPLMSGPDVGVVQHELGIVEDNQYGPITAGAVKHWKFEFGFASAQVNTDFTTGEQPYLLKPLPPGPLMKLRAKSRAKAIAKAQTVAANAVDIEKGWVALGFREMPADSNKVPAMVPKARAAGLSAWFQAMGWPWCAFAGALGAKLAGDTTASKDGFAGGFNVLYCPAWLAEAHSHRHGLREINRNDVRKGDVILFDWDKDGIADHFGRYVGPSVMGLMTVEGNTSYGDAGSQSNGGCMAQRNRAWSDVIAVIREDA